MLILLKNKEKKNNKKQPKHNKGLEAERRFTGVSQEKKKNKERKYREKLRNM